VWLHNHVTYVGRIPATSHPPPPPYPPPPQYWSQTCFICRHFTPFLCAPCKYFWTLWPLVCTYQVEKVITAYVLSHSLFFPWLFTTLPFPASPLQPWRRRQYISPKRWYPFTSLLGLTAEITSSSRHSPSLNKPTTTKADNVWFLLQNMHRCCTPAVRKSLQ
jgi:hypothetical protein